MKKLDENNKKEDNEISDLEKELEEILKEAEKMENNANISVKIDSTASKGFNRVFNKNIVVDSILKILFGVLLMFTINYFFPFMRLDLLSFMLFSFISITLDFIIKEIFNKKLFIFNLISFGLIDMLILIMSLVLTGVILNYTIDIKFLSFSNMLIDFIIFYVIRKFIYKYFKLKLLKL